MNKTILFYNTLSGFPLKILNNISEGYELTTNKENMCTADALYNEYPKWKNRSFDPEFNSFLNITGEHPLNRLCKMVGDEPQLIL